MSYTAIQVEHLSKKYFLRRQTVSNYTALRDVLSERIAGLAKGRVRSTSREEFLALDDVSFNVTAGDRVGIIGRNGAGKSTLLKVLSRVVSPTRGRIIIDGRIASLLEVGTGFHPELTGRENIFLNGAILGMPRREIREKFDRIVDFSETEKFLDTPVKRYSSGMYVRLAFAVAAHIDPDILIVDEVLAVGDQAFQRKCLGRMREVAGEGRTVLFVSHNMSAVQRLCNKGILLDKGRLVADGTIDAVTDQYLKSFSEMEPLFEFPEPADPDAQCHFCRIQIEDGEGKPAREIPVGGHFLIRVAFRVKRRVEGLVVGLGLTTLLEQPVRTSWSGAESFTPGDYEAIFSNDGVYLADGQYKLVIGLSQQGRSLQYIDNAGLFAISEVNVMNEPRIINTKSGLVMNQMAVDIRRLD